MYKKMWRKEWCTALQTNACIYYQMKVHFDLLIWDFQLEMQRKEGVIFYFENVLLENIDRFRVQSSYQIVKCRNHPLGSSNLIACKPYNAILTV